MEKNVVKGTVCSIFSAVVFGFTPVLASWSFELGSNAATLTFYRNSMVLPIMLAVLLIRKIDLTLTKSQFLQLAFISVFFSASTTFLLYASYKYIGVGLGTTLHFLYPVITVLAGFVFFRDKLSRDRIVALILAFLGVAMASGVGGSFGLIGVILAVSSAVTYSGYLIAIEKSVIKDMDSIKAMFYMCLVNSIVLPILDMPFGNIIYSLDFKPMIYTVIVAVTNSMFAYVLLIIGIGFIGAGNAAIFSTLEPLSGVVCGVIFLGEALPFAKLTSCIIILVAVSIPVFFDWRKQRYL